MNFHFLLVLLCTSFVFGEVTRTPWVYQRTAAGQYPVCPAGASFHGNPVEYTVAVIPAEDSNWLPCNDSWCTNPETLGITSASRLSDCFAHLDFGYFQTFVTIPVGFELTDATVDFTVMDDDGARVTIFNSKYPDGIIDANSYVYLGQQHSSNFSQYLIEGLNRVLITQVDDCQYSNDITAVLSLNGVDVPVCTLVEDDCNSVITNGCGKCVLVPKPSGTNCSDGNACTVGDSCHAGVCRPGGQKCCSIGSSCGLCTRDCAGSALNVLAFFNVAGTQLDVSASFGGCGGPYFCCTPKNQSRITNTNGVCSYSN